MILALQYSFDISSPKEAAVFISEPLQQELDPKELKSTKFKQSLQKKQNFSQITKFIGIIESNLKKLVGIFEQELEVFLQTQDLI